MDLLNLFYKSFNTLKSIDTLKQKLIIIAWVLPLLIKNKNKYYINFLLKRIFLQHLQLNGKAYAFEASGYWFKSNKMFNFRALKIVYKYYKYLQYYSQPPFKTFSSLNKIYPKTFNNLNILLIRVIDHLPLFNLINIFYLYL